MFFIGTQFSILYTSTQVHLRTTTPINSYAVDVARRAIRYSITSCNTPQVTPTFPLQLKLQNQMMLIVPRDLLVVKSFHRSYLE